MKTFKESRKPMGEFKKHLAFAAYASVKVKKYQKRMNALSKELKYLEKANQKNPSHLIEKRVSEIQIEFTKMNAELEQDQKRFKKTEEFFK